MDANKMERIVEFMLNMGTGYQDIFEGDPEAKTLYIEECKKFLCDGYLAGNLTDEERQNFEKMLREDITLREQLAFRNEIDKFLYEEATMLNNLDKIAKHDNYSPTNTKAIGRARKTNHLFEKQLKTDAGTSFTHAIPEKKAPLKALFENGNWIAAASILFLIAFTTFYTITHYTHSNNHDLFAEYYQPFNETFVHSSGSHNLYDAKKKYQTGKYKESHQLYCSLNENIEVDQEIQFYYALTMIELEKYTEAIEHLNNFRDKYKLSRFYPYASWYLTLCYMKTDQMKKAMPILYDIAAYSGPNSKEAKELLRSLSKLPSNQDRD